MRLLAQTFTFRYSVFRKDFVFSGTLMQNEDGSVTLINVPTRCAPIDRVSPLAVYDQHTEHLRFTIRGIRYLRDFNIILPSEVRLDDIHFEKA